MPPRRILACLAVAAAAAACSKGGSVPPAASAGTPVGAPGTPPGAAAADVPPAVPPPQSDAPPGPAPASVGAGNGLVVTTLQGLFVLDPPFAGEPTFEGAVQVDLNGAAPPADTVVELNGVRLAPHAGGSSVHSYYAVDPAGPQPALDAGGYLTVTARTGSLVRSVPLACPTDVLVYASKPAGASLSGLGALEFTWGADLMRNPENAIPSDYYANAKLRGLDVASRALAEGVVSHALVPQGARGVRVGVGPTEASGYAFELRWSGPYVVEAGSRAFCGRAKRIAYAR